MDGHHYVLVALLRCEGDCSCLVGVDGAGEVIDVDKSFIGFSDRYMVGG